MTHVQQADVSLPKTRQAAAEAMGGVMENVTRGIGWLLVEPDIAFGGGECQVSTNYMTDELLPDHPALPAIAVWVQEPGRTELLRRVLYATLDQPVLDDATEALAGMNTDGLPSVALPLFPDATPVQVNETVYWGRA